MNVLSEGRARRRHHDGLLLGLTLAFSAGVLFWIGVYALFRWWL